jgi:hypothetical protein
MLVLILSLANGIFSLNWHERPTNLFRSEAAAHPRSRSAGTLAAAQICCHKAFISKT